METSRGAILASLALLASCAAPLDTDPRLVLLVSVDTLRADRLGAHGSLRGLTPRLDALAAESTVFRAGYAPTSHTLPSTVSLLTGRYPEELGIWSNESVLAGATPTLASVLRERGWRAHAVVSNPILRAHTGLDAGFDAYDDTMERFEATRAMPERTAAATTDAALRQLDVCTADAADCFLWVHYQDPHGPYTPPEGLRERYLAAERAEPGGTRELPLLDGPFGPGGIPSYQAIGDAREVAFYRAGYAAEIAYLDGEIGRLLDGLAERARLDSAWVVFTADHGESLGEDDFWFSHGELLSEALVHVPLWIRGPGVAAGVRSDLASLVDVQPTLLARLLDAPPQVAASGRDLLAPGAETAEPTLYLAALRGADVPRFGIVEPDFKYLVEARDGVWDGRLTRRGRDDVDLTAPAPHVAQAMRGRLVEARRRYHVMDQERRREPAEDERRALEALGYAAPAEAP